METAINAIQDGRSCDLSVYKPGSICDANVLYESWLKTRKTGMWKTQVQMFDMNLLSNLYELQTSIVNRTYAPKKPTSFILHERGKIRYISGNQVSDRVVEHALNDNFILPAIRNYLIYDNGASLKGKGVDFTRRRLVKHLVQFYNKHGNNGYVLLVDFSKYYDNIRHEILLNMYRRCIDDEEILWVIEAVLKQFEVDVQYMSEDERKDCLNILFDSVKYHELGDNMFCGTPFMMRKHLNIGNQTSQSCGIFYPTSIDNYIKIVEGNRWYGRYSDDSYILHHDKGYLLYLKEQIKSKCCDLGIFVNESKTRIVKVSDRWRFLQLQYRLCDNGKIERRINPKTITRMRRKMKKLSSKVTRKYYDDWFRSWLRNYKKYMTAKQYNSIVRLYHEEASNCTK